MSTTAMPEFDTIGDARRWRRRRIAAILAGGMVLGIGAAVTLAAWTDNEFATGTFTAGKFGIEGSVDGGTTWADHPVGAPGTLAFTLPTATDLAPNDVAYASFGIREIAGSTRAGSYVLSAVTTTGTVSNLTVQVLSTTSATCSAATTGTTLVTAGSAITSTGTGTSVATVKGANATTPGTATYLCFAVTAGTGLSASQTGTVTWQFTATSA